MTKPKILLKTSYNHDVLLSNNKYDLILNKKTPSQFTFERFKAV